MSKEAMKLALEALEGWGKGFPDNWGDLDTEAVTALREALSEQPAQRCPLCNYQHGHAIGCENNPVDIALNKMAENARELGLDYTITPTSVGIGKPMSDHRLMAAPSQTDWEAVAADQAMTIALLKAEQPAQPQPVAHQYSEMRDDGTWSAWLGCDKPLLANEQRRVRALYTSPPAQRQPLTDEAQVLRTLLGAALGALRYHTEQTRPIQRTKETIAAIEYELAAHGIKENT